MAVVILDAVVGVVDEIDEFCRGMMTIQEGMSSKE